MPPVRRLTAILSGRTEQAVAHARKAIEGNRNFALPYCVLALASTKLGGPDEAAEAVRQLARVAPQFHLGSLRRIRLADAVRLQSDIELLQATQLPE
jgi:hypothetical protein